MSVFRNVPTVVVVRTEFVIVEFVPIKLVLRKVPTVAVVFTKFDMDVFELSIFVTDIKPAIKVPTVAVVFTKFDIDVFELAIFVTDIKPDIKVPIVPVVTLKFVPIKFVTVVLTKLVLFKNVFPTTPKPPLIVNAPVVNDIDCVVSKTSTPVKKDCLS
jgi:hypothetical protein